MIKRIQVRYPNLEEKDIDILAESSVGLILMDDVNGKGIGRVLSSERLEGTRTIEYEIEVI